VDELVCGLSMEGGDGFDRTLYVVADDISSLRLLIAQSSDQHVNRGKNIRVLHWWNTQRALM